MGVRSVVYKITYLKPQSNINSILNFAAFNLNIDFNFLCAKQLFANIAHSNYLSFNVGRFNSSRPSL